MPTYLIEPKPSLDDLAHHGVKGMHWGIRRNEPTNARYTPNSQAQDRQTYGKAGVKRINRRMNKGQSRKKAQNREFLRTLGKGTALLGGTYVALILTQHGDQIYSELGARVSSRAQRNRGRAAAAAAMGLGAAESNQYFKRSRKGVYNITTL